VRRSARPWRERLRTAGRGGVAERRSRHRRHRLRRL